MRHFPEHDRISAQYVKTFARRFPLQPVTLSSRMYAREGLDKGRVSFMTVKKDRRCTNLYKEDHIS